MYGFIELDDRPCSISPFRTESLTSTFRTLILQLLDIMVPHIQHVLPMYALNAETNDGVLCFSHSLCFFYLSPGSPEVAHVRSYIFESAIVGHSLSCCLSLALHFRYASVKDIITTGDGEDEY